jgi:hypothetical protein
MRRWARTAASWKALLERGRQYFQPWPASAVRHVGPDETAQSVAGETFCGALRREIAQLRAVQDMAGRRQRQRPESRGAAHAVPGGCGTSGFDADRRSSC